MGARVNGAFSDGATTLDGQSRKREFLSLGLDYRGSALSASIDAYHSQESFQGGTPAMFWFGGSVVPKAPDPRINQFSTGYGSIQSNAVVGRAEYRFNDNVSVFGGIGRRDSHQSGLINGTHARQIDANGNFTGSIIGQRAYTDATSAEAGLRSRFKTGAVGHELVLQAPSWIPRMGRPRARPRPSAPTSTTPSLRSCRVCPTARPRRRKTP
ncbi:hypothetical protein WJ973_12670 [Achromobacter xylosoxidans]